MFDSHQFTSLRAWKIPIKWSKKPINCNKIFLSVIYCRIWREAKFKIVWELKIVKIWCLRNYKVSLSLQSVNFYLQILALRKQLIRGLWATIQCKYIKILTSSLSNNNNSSKGVKLKRNPECCRCCRWVIRWYWVTIHAPTLHEMQVQCLLCL